MRSENEFDLLFEFSFEYHNDIFPVDFSEKIGKVSEVDAVIRRRRADDRSGLPQVQQRLAGTGLSGEKG